VGDPAFVKVPVEKLLSKEHAASQRERLSRDKAMHWPIAGGIHPSETGTTTFHIVDREGNAIAVTTSQGANFLVVPGTGINMNNRMRMFDIAAGNPNLVLPGKKVRHTSNPSMAFKDGELFMSFGASGVDTQPQNQLWEFLSVVEWGFSPQEVGRWKGRRAFVSADEPPVQGDRGIGPGKRTVQPRGDQQARGQGTQGHGSGGLGYDEPSGERPENGRFDRRCRVAERRGHRNEVRRRG
jgi:gamma-glutamyltranspeptidase/glutathione hydrolase